MAEINKEKVGKVFLVGAGPGDVSLVTLKASELIKTCDVLVFDHLANSELRRELQLVANKLMWEKVPVDIL